MKQPSHADSFRTATGNPPYDWQRRLAEDPECRPRLIDIPAGLAWQGNRLGREECDKPWPLAEKSRSGSLPLPPDDANRRAADSTLSWLAARSPAIPIGAQDMLLSRGYLRSRYRWPISSRLQDRTRSNGERSPSRPTPSRTRRGKGRKPPRRGRPTFGARHTAARRTPTASERTPPRGSFSHRAATSSGRSTSSRPNDSRKLLVVEEVTQIDSLLVFGDQMIVERVQPPGCRVGLELTVPPLLKARPEPFDQCLELILGNKIASLGPRFQAPRSKGPRSEERGNMDCSACQLRWISLQWRSRRRKSRKNPLTP